MNNLQKYRFKQGLGKNHYADIAQNYLAFNSLAS